MLIKAIIAIPLKEELVNIHRTTKIASILIVYLLIKPEPKDSVDVEY